MRSVSFPYAKCKFSVENKDTSVPPVSVNAVSRWQSGVVRDVQRVGRQKGSQCIEDNHDGAMVPVGAWEDGTQLIPAEFLHGANVPGFHAEPTARKGAFSTHRVINPVRCVAAISHASTPGAHVVVTH